MSKLELKLLEWTSPGYEKILYCTALAKLGNFPNI
jgi:hypothetical protein